MKTGERRQRQPRHTIAHTSTSLPKLVPSGGDANGIRRDHTPLRNKPQSSQRVSPGIASGWTNEDDENQRLFENTGKLPRPQPRRSDISLQSVSMLSSVSTTDLSSIKRSPRRSDATSDTLAALEDRRSSFASGLRAAVRSCSAPVQESQWVDPSTPLPSPRRCSTGGAAVEKLNKSFTSLAAIDSPNDPEAGSDTTSVRTKSAGVASIPCDDTLELNDVGINDVSNQQQRAMKLLENEVAFLRSVILSESRCKQELEAAVAQARSDFADTLAKKDAEIKVLTEELGKKTEAARVNTEATAAAMTTQSSVMDTRITLLTTQLAERDDDLAACKTALVAAQNSQKLQLEHVNRLTAEVRRYRPKVGIVDVPQTFHRFFFMFAVECGPAKGHPFAAGSNASKRNQPK